MDRTVQKGMSLTKWEKQATASGEVKRAGDEVIRSARLPINEYVSRDVQVIRLSFPLSSLPLLLDLSLLALLFPCLTTSQGRGHVLNINVVFHVLVEFTRTQDWKQTLTEAFDKLYPIR